MKLVERKGVELVRVGKWPALTGEAIIDKAKVDSIIEASKQSWWDGAPIGPGHLDKRFSRMLSDGEPALGGARNLRLSDDGQAVIGDYVGVPEKLDKLLPVAYPNRSIEWEENYVAPDGKTYPAVLRGVALLGTKQPGVAGLRPVQSIEDVYELYAASTEEENESFRSAFVGENGAAVVQALSALNEIIHAPLGENVHDGLRAPSDKSQSRENRGDHRMTDLDVSALREALELQESDDVLEAVRKLKAEKPATSEAPAPQTPAQPEAKPVEPVKPAEAPVVPAEQPAVESLKSVEITQAMFDDMQRRLAIGEAADKRLKENDITLELQAASRAGRLAPSDLEDVKAEMLESPEKEEAVRKMLGRMPAVFNTVETGTSDESAATTAAAEADYQRFVTATGGNV